MEPGNSEPLNLSIKKRPVAVVTPSTAEEGVVAPEAPPDAYMQLLQYMGGGREPQDALSSLIHTNMLTNKIATSNLLTIINKLLEQNIVSEYYFKMQQRQPDNNNLLEAKLRAGAFGLRGFDDTRSRLA